MTAPAASGQNGAMSDATTGERSSTAKDAQARRGGGAGAVAVIVVLLFALPLIYVLAIGPIVWLHDRGHIEITPNSIIGIAYRPLEYAAQECKPVEASIEWYVSLWTLAPQVTPAVALPPATPMPSPAITTSAPATAAYETASDPAAPPAPTDPDQDH